MFCSNVPTRDHRKWSHLTTSDYRLNNRWQHEVARTWDKLFSHFVWHFQLSDWSNCQWEHRILLTTGASNICNQPSVSKQCTRNKALPVWTDLNGKYYFASHVRLLFCFCFFSTPILEFLLLFAGGGQEAMLSRCLPIKVMHTSWLTTLFTLLTGSQTKGAPVDRPETVVQHSHPESVTDWSASHVSDYRPVHLMSHSAQCAGSSQRAKIKFF